MEDTGTPTTLYRLYDADKNLLYVGITFDAKERLRQHRQSKDWWASVAAVETEQFLNRHSAAVAEVAAIERDRPRFNIRTALDGRRDRPDVFPHEVAPARRRFEDAKQRLSDTKAAYQIAKLAVDDANERIKRAIIAALAVGVPVASIAAEAGLSVPRIYQIRDGRR